MLARNTVWALLVVLAGCAARKPATYRLVGQEPGQVLVPPGVSNPALQQRTFTADVEWRRRVCRSADDAIRIEPHRQKLRVTVARDALVSQPAGWLKRWAAGEAEGGCIAPGQEEKLAAEIAQALPLEANMPYRLLHPSDRQGFVDLGPENRLQVVSPILAPGAADLIGYETAWYTIRPREGGGFALAPLLAERHIQGSVETRPQPAADYLRLGPQASVYRLVYKTDQANGVVSEFVIGGGTHAEVERQTAEIEGSGGACEAARCAAIPSQVAVNPFVMVTANGRELAVPTGATVRSVLQAAGEGHPETVPDLLTLERIYRGKLVAVEFDRGNPEVLGLLLMGGERISWQGGLAPDMNRHGAGL